MVLHGLPRTTLDLDLYVPGKQDTLINLFEILSALKLKSDQHSVLAMADRPHLFRDQWICFSHAGEDILDVYLARVEDFEELRKGSTIMKNAGLSIRVSSLNDLEILKKASGRPVDKADLYLIREAKQIRRRKRISSK